MLKRGFKLTAKVMCSVALALAFLTLWTVAPMTGLPRAHAAGSDPTYRYTKTFALQDSNAYAFGAGTATDANGNVYIDGYFLGTVTFDGQGGSDTHTAQNYEAFVTKYDKVGAYQWTKILDSNANSSHSFAHNIAVDGNNNVYLSGNFNGTVIFDGTGGSHSVTADAGNTSNFLTKLSADGAYGWTKTYDVATGNMAEAGVAIDRTNGYIYAAGQYNGTIAFDGPGGSSTQDSGSDDAVYVVKYNLDGDYVSTKTLKRTGGISAARNAYGGNNVAVDSNGGMYIGGTLAGTVAVNGTGQSFTSANGTSFLIKFNVNGSYAWGKTFDVSSGSSNARNYSLASSGSNVYMVGRFTGTAVFDGTGGTDSVTAPNIASYVTAFSTGGTHGWTKTIDTSADVSYSAQAQVVTTDGWGDVYVGGTSYGELAFDGPGGTDVHGTGITVATNYLTKLSPDGSYKWTRLLYPDGGTNGGVQDVPYMGVATNRLGNVFLAGNFYGQMTFDGPGGADTQSAGTDGVFLTSFSAFNPLPVPPTVSAASLPGAPQTGFGESAGSANLYGVIGVILAGLFLAGLQLVHRKQS
jgi:hypothetical protein